MKVIFNCKYFKFHEDYCENILNELNLRGHLGIISVDEKYYDDADFTIQPDEACKKQGGKGVWINHAFPFIPHNRFYLEQNFKNNLKENSDFIFTFSEEWKKNHETYGIETYVVGMPKLDGLFNVDRDINDILYAPTWNEDLTSLNNVNIEKLKNYGNIMFRGHPAFHENKISYKDSMIKAGIVISDYSSVGLEAIALNIPTILFESREWAGKRFDHISNKAMEAAICVTNQSELEQAIQKYKNEPKYLENKRLEYSEKLCSHKNNSSKIFVDQLEKLI